jgi:hypothetical protein
VTCKSLPPFSCRRGAQKTRKLARFRADHPFEGCIGGFGDRGVHEVGQLPAAASMHDADQVAKKRRVDPLAALVGRDPGELEKLVHLLLGELEAGRILTGGDGQPVARV